MDARQMFRDGRLTEAVAAMSEEVKKHPADSQRRGLLAEFLCLLGNFDKADLHLDAIADKDPEAAPGIAMFRQLIRAEQARRQFFAEGRVPECVGVPPETMRLSIEASVRVREGALADAAAILAKAEEGRPKCAGTSDGAAFEDFRDLDDLTAGVFEVLTSTGKYFWIPTDAVDSVEFRAPTRPRDLMWRRARMVVRGGPDGEVFLPAVYASAGPPTEDAARLARSTDWTGGDNAPVRGVGQRTYLVGEQARAIHEIREIRFAERTA